jgi:hypothetical protein
MTSPTELTSDYFKNMVSTMREQSTHKKTCLDEKDLLRKCILCKKFMSSQEWGPVMESFLKTSLQIDPKINEISGDGHKNGNNIEIKVSLGSKSGQLNLVQIRPDHTIDYYLFVGYNLYEGDIGKAYVMKIPAADLYALLPIYGGYAHGTIKELGKITSTNIKGRNCEYALRPNPTLNDRCAGKRLWIEMLKYRVEFEESAF